MARCGSTSREKRQDDEGVRIKPGSLADGLGLKEVPLRPRLFSPVQIEDG
jgi:hypothetical protein